MATALLPALMESLPALLAEIADLQTYESAERLRPQIESTLDELQRLVRGLDVEGVRAVQALNAYKKDHSSGGLSKFFKSGGKVEAELKGHVDEVQAAREEVRAGVRRLQDALDFTPHSALEREGILKELRLRRKELLERGHRITHVTHGPRLMRAPTPLALGVEPAAYERRKARYAREAEALPGEGNAQAHARQLAWIDSAITWVERFPAGE